MRKNSPKNDYDHEISLYETALSVLLTHALIELHHAGINPVKIMATKSTEKEKEVFTDLMIDCLFIMKKRLEALKQ